MRQTRKGKQWYFSMKLHIGTGTRGTVHSVTPPMLRRPKSSSCRSCCTARRRHCWRPGVLERVHRDCAKEAGVRYRGIAKNLARAQVAFALANLYSLRGKLLPPQARCACRREMRRESPLQPPKRTCRGWVKALRGL